MGSEMCIRDRGIRGFRELVSCIEKSDENREKRILRLARSNLIILTVRANTERRKRGNSFR